MRSRAFLAAVLFAVGINVLRADQSASAPHRTDLAALEMGGRIERVTSQYDHRDWDPINLLGTLPHNEGAWSSDDKALPKNFPQDVVISIFGREPAMVAAVVIDLHTRNSKEHWAKDVEIWTSMNEADDTFAKVGQKTLADDQLHTRPGTVR